MRSTDEFRAQVLRAAQALCAGLPVPDDLWSPEAVRAAYGDGRWVPVRAGWYKVGDRVRVRPDAYDGDKARHSGKAGRVVAVRNGSAVVIYDDDPPGSVGHHHRPEALEQRVTSGGAR